MEQMTATSVLSLLETNKEQRQTFIEGILSAIEAGSIDPLKVHYQLKCLEKIAEEIGANRVYRERVRAAAEAYGSKEFAFNNSQVKISEVGTKYDYSKCEDIELVAWLIESEALTKKIKDRQKLLQSLPPKGIIITNEESGETYTIYPPSKTSTSFITMTLK